MNHLPRQVREQFERSEALHQQLLGNTGQPTPPQPEVPTPPLTPEATPPVETPTPAVETPTPAPAPAVPAVEPVVDSWELKYRVLQGKYNKEVPALHARIAELEKAPAAPAPAPVAASGLTPDQVTDQYGEDFTRAVAAVAQATVAPVQTRMDSVQESVAQNARREFLADVARLVPNFQAIDADPRFTAYLDELDPMTGRFRREFFNEADSNNDANRIAVFFRGFSQATAPAQPPVAPQAPAPAAPPSVDHLIAPDSSRHSEAPAGKKLWTGAETRAFYRDATAKPGKPWGKYTQADYERISKDIDASIAEGRYRG